MLLFDLLGAALTLVTVATLGLGGYLLALVLLREEAAKNPLALAVATLLAATAEAVAIGLLLGAAGLLRFPLALALEVGLILLLLALARRGAAAATGAGSGGLGNPARLLAARTWAQIASHPALSIITLHAIAAEALRGLFRPPLSWDSLMYHLLLTGTWLQQGNLAPVFGAYPVNYYGFVPANGSVWFWWWMAPSHSELYVNLASLPHWTLLGLAAGGVARRLGAARSWPLASFLVLLTPTVVRFAATQYVDIFLGAALVAAAYFGLRWLREPRAGEAALAGMGLGLAAGAKVLGLPYAAALAGALVLGALGLGAWRRRPAHLALALVLAVALGGYFYLRNVAWGAGPLALTCEGSARGEQGVVVPSIPRANSVLQLWRTVGQTQLLDAFLGITRPQSVELGVGPQALVLLAAVLALPFAVGRARRREGLVAASQVAAELAFWLTVPFSAQLHIFANIRYLIPGLALALAGGAAIAERTLSEPWRRGLALALAVQSLLQLHAEMPHGVRIALAAADLAAVALALSPSLRGLVVRRAPLVAGLAVVLAVAAAPALARFRVEDRPRALATEWTAHQTSARLFAAGWAWLARFGGNGAVAVSNAPGNYFVYPAMGPYLERRVVFANVNRADLANAAQYPNCDPRVDLSPEAWIANLRKHGIRWVLLGRYPEFDFSPEGNWAAGRPDLFALRYGDQTNLVYELLPEPAASR